MQKSLCAMAVLASISLSAMAESVDVRVIGTITAAACTPTLSGGGTVDYGAISPGLLSDTDYTVMPEKMLDFAITCDAPAKIALRAISGRPGTTAGVTETSAGAGQSPISIFGRTDGAVVGLGLADAAKVGGYGIRITPGTVTADGTDVDSLRKTDSGTTWTNDFFSGHLYDPKYNRQISWASTGTLVPVAFTTLAGKLSVQAYINKASELDLTVPVALDGLTTIELVYL